MITGKYAFDSLRVKRLHDSVVRLTILSWAATFLLKTVILFFAWNCIVVRAVDCVRLPVLSAICFTLCIELYSKLRIDFASEARQELKRAVETAAKGD